MKKATPAKSPRRRKVAVVAATFASLAAELSNAFVTDTRADGSTFTKLKDGGTGWLANGWEGIAGRCHRAVDSRGPDDWIYGAAADIAQKLTDYGDDDTTADDFRDRGYISEIADGMVDVYNSDRAKWLAADIRNAGLVDEAVEELGHSEQGIFGDIGAGQYRAYEAIANTLVEAIEQELAARE